MSDTTPVPVALVRGFAEVWRTLAGGQVEEVDCAAGLLVTWCGPGGGPQALPDRMYGLVEPRKAVIEPHDVPEGVLVNLPPGVSAASAEPHCLGHHLDGSAARDVWDSLRRVGRQGVDKARRTGCRGAAISDEDYLQLAGLKASALGGRAPEPGLIGALRSIFGDDQIQLTGVRFQDQAVAAVLAVSVDGYGMLIDGASDRSHWNKNPNNLCVWSAVSCLVESGCSHVDYGFSPVGAGDARFKDHMGGREVPLFQVLGV